MTPDKILRRRDAAELAAAQRDIGQRCKAAQLSGHDRFFWEQFAIGDAISDPGVPLEMALAGAVGSLWRCGLLDRLPETEHELLDIGGRLRDSLNERKPAQLEGERRAQ